jgi:hypothetical protein
MSTLGLLMMISGIILFIGILIASSFPAKKKKRKYSSRPTSFRAPRKVRVGEKVG